MRHSLKYLAALDALGGKLLLITFSTINVMLLGDEGFCANRVLASTADKTLLVPLAGLVFHFLHTCGIRMVSHMLTLLHGFHRNVIIVFHGILRF